MTQQEDVFFGIKRSGRHECPHVVGPIITIVPLRTTVRQSLSGKDFLEIMRD